MTDGGGPQHDVSTHDARLAARGSAAAALGQVLGRGAAVILVLTASRLLDPELFARYSVVAALVVVGTLLADFGTNATIVRQVSRGPDRARDVCAVALPASALLGALTYVGIVAFAAVAYASQLRTDVAVGAVAVPLAAMSGSALAVLDGLGRLTTRPRVTFLQSALLAVIGISALVAGAGPRGLAFSFASAGLVAFVLATDALRRAGLLPARLVVRADAVLRFLRSALPFATLTLIGAVSLRFDVVLLSLLSDEEDVANYDLALRATEAILAFHTVVTGPALFLFSGRLGRGDVAGAQRAFDEAVRLAYLVGVPVSVLAVVLREPLATSLFGAEFADAADPLAILGGHVVVALVGYLQGSLLVAGDHQRRGIAVSAAVTLVLIALDLALIPSLGARGAALAALATSVVTVTAFAAFHRSTSRIRTPLPELGTVLAGAACVGASWALRGTLLGAVAAGATAYALVLVATKTITKRDLQRLVDMVRVPSPR